MALEPTGCMAGSQAKRRIIAKNYPLRGFVRRLWIKCLGNVAKWAHRTNRFYCPSPAFRCVLAELRKSLRVSPGRCVSPRYSGYQAVCF